MRKLFMTIAFEHGLIEQLKLDINRLDQLLARIEKGYKADLPCAS